MAEARFSGLVSPDPDPSKSQSLAWWEQRVYFDGVPRRRREIVPSLAATPGMTEQAARLFLASAEVADGTAPLLPPWVVGFEGQPPLSEGGHWMTKHGQHMYVSKDGEIEAGGHPELRKALVEKGGLKEKGGFNTSGEQSPTSGIDKIMADIAKNPPEKTEPDAVQKANGVEPAHVYVKGTQVKRYDGERYGHKHGELNDSLQKNNHIASSLMNGDIDGLRRHFHEGDKASKEDLVRGSVDSLMDESEYHTQQYAKQFDPKLEHASGQTLRNGLMNIARDRMNEDGAVTAKIAKEHPPKPPKEKKAPKAKVKTPSVLGDEADLPLAGNVFKAGPPPTKKASVRDIVKAVTRESGGRFDMMGGVEKSGVVSNMKFLALLPPSGKDRDALIQASRDATAKNGGTAGRFPPHEEILKKFEKDASPAAAKAVGHAPKTKDATAKTLLRDDAGNSAVIASPELAPVLRLWPKASMHVVTQKQYGGPDRHHVLLKDGGKTVGIVMGLIQDAKEARVVGLSGGSCWKQLRLFRR